MYNGIESTIFWGIVGSFLLMLTGQFFLVILVWAFLLFIYMPAKRDEQKYNSELCDLLEDFLNHKITLKEHDRLVDELKKKYGLK